MRPRWHKVLRDLYHNRTRTALVVLSIAVGVFAFGTIMAARIVITRELRDSYLAINPVGATITTTPFSEELLDAVRRVPGVAEAEGRRVVAARVQVGPGLWQDTQLFLLPDDGVRSLGIVRPEAGAWPAPDKALLVERAALIKLNAGLGDTVRVALPGQSARDLPIAGLTHDLSLPPAVIAGQAFAYVNAETMAWLGGPADYNQVEFTVREGREDADHIREVAAAVERVIERSGRPAIVIDVPTPLQHPAETVLPTMMLVMTTLGVLALLISGFLIVNTISAILTQQLRQIGIMKALGARSSQIMGLYFALSAAFGALALLIAAPLGALGAYSLTGFIAGQLNIDLAGFRAPPEIIAVQAAAALLVPLLTAAAPIRGVVRRPAREALSGEVNAPPAHSPFDSLLGRISALARPTRLALRNTFRRRGRLIRTLAALSLGGAVFVTVITLRTSLYSTLDESIASQRYDVEVQLSRQYREGRAVQSVLAAPGVVGVESLLRAQAFPVRADGSTGEGVALRALPADTILFAPRMTDGRWLLPEDDRAVVLSTNFTAKEPAIQIGDLVTLEIGESQHEWRVVGWIEEFIPPINPAIAYVPLDAYTRAIGGVGRSDTLRVATVGHDPASHAAAAAALEARLEQDGLEVQLIRSRSEERAILNERFNLLTAVLSIMALIIGTVGGLGLAGTMSINVLERAREIGIMRAIGASDRAVRQIVLGEGLTIATLAWLIGTILSVPMSLGMCYAFGKALLNVPLAWNYSLPAVAMWLGIVLLIASLASLLPARAAARLTVREVLAYE